MLANYLLKIKKTITRYPHECTLEPKLDRNIIVTYGQSNITNDNNDNITSDPTFKSPKKKKKKCIISVYVCMTVWAGMRSKSHQVQPTICNLLSTNSLSPLMRGFWKTGDLVCNLHTSKCWYLHHCMKIRLIAYYFQTHELSFFEKKLFRFLFIWTSRQKVLIISVYHN